jgi:hypothetical protein
MTVVRENPYSLPTPSALSPPLIHHHHNWAQVVHMIEHTAVECLDPQWLVGLLAEPAAAAILLCPAPMQHTDTVPRPTHEVGDGDGLEQ